VEGPANEATSLYEIQRLARLEAIGCERQVSPDGAEIVAVNAGAVRFPTLIDLVTTAQGSYATLS
jgi:hypothetical protein